MGGVFLDKSWLYQLFHYAGTVKSLAFYFLVLVLIIVIFIDTAGKPHGDEDVEKDGRNVKT